MSVYNELRLAGQLCDAVVRVDDAEFSVHKVILCNCSPYFKALFTHWSTPDSGHFDIPNVSADMMKLIIEFAYTGFVPVTRHNLQELFVAADQFNVLGIVQACCSFLEEHMSPQNCIAVWWFTEVCYTPQLKHKAFLFMLKHFEEVASTSVEFLLLSVEELVKIIEDDNLNVKRERTVFRAVLHWISFCTEERRQHIPLLLSRVRLALVDPDYLTSSVFTNELVSSSAECRSLLIRTMEILLDDRTSLFDSSCCDPLARPRLPPAVLLAIAGWSDGSPTNGIEAYDVRADCWVTVPHSEHTPRAYHGTVFLNGSVYCIGGFNSFEQFSSVSRFDLETHTWQEVMRMHSSRCYVSVTTMNGRIYAMGGYDGHQRLRTAECYQPETNQWTLIAPMHERRSDANCTTLRGKVYICGGFNGSECLPTAESYDPDTNQWTLIASMSCRRSGVGVIAHADHVFAVGGFDGFSRLQTVEAYNPHTHTWHPAPSMLGPRSNFGVAVLDDRLFAVGGFDGLTTTQDVECYDAENDEWTEVCFMRISRSALSCCVVSGLPNLAEYASPHVSLQSSTVQEQEVD